MHMKNFKKYINILLIFLIIGASGCAGRSYKPDIGQSGRLRIDNRKYSDILEIVKENRLSWQWDAFNNVITVKNPKFKAKLYPGSSLVLCGKQIHDLGDPVVESNGKIMVPNVFSGLIQGKTVIIEEEKVKTADFSIRTVVIDAGHGGKDPGALGPGDIKEKDIVLDIAKRLAVQLREEKINVVMTRDTDIFHSLEKRSEIANNAKADFFVSIHANAAEARSANGFEAFYLSNDYDDHGKAVQMRENAAIKYEENAEYVKSKDLNATLWDMIFCENRIESIEMANSISSSLQKRLELRTRYIRGANFYVLKGAYMPAVLLEVGYLSNATEAKRLNNPYYRQMLAEAIAAGIIDYKKAFELNEGFSL